MINRKPRQIITEGREFEKMKELLNTPLRELNKVLAEKSLSEFVRLMWPTMDPHDYVHGWHIDAICEHV
ncbi:MAG: hypothetical protein RBR35_19150, partial [Salinivirgaceae bacterium]|nr:hypothetical protein [Salinivirgaceae bacterium]